MTGNQDDEQGGCGGARETAASCAGWMEPLFLMMKAKIEETAKSVCETDVKDAAVAEKVARQIVTGASPEVVAATAEELFT